MVKRRAKGEGGIYKRQDGRWAGQYEVDTATGTRRRYIYGKTRKEVAEKLRKALADRDEGLAFSEGNLRLGDYLNRWLNDSVRDTVKAATLEGHRIMVRVHIAPSLGHIKLKALTPPHIQVLYRQKLDAGLSPSSVQCVHKTLHKALKQAVRWGLILRNVSKVVDVPSIVTAVVKMVDPVRRTYRAPSNPYSLAQLASAETVSVAQGSSCFHDHPRVNSFDRRYRPEIKPLSTQQVKCFLYAAKDDRLFALYQLAVTTGLRLGELLGLHWKDVDLSRRVLSINRTLIRTGANKLSFNRPKTGKSRRSVLLTPDTVEVLKEHRQRQQIAGLYSEEGLVFCTRKGTPLNPSNVRNRSFKPLLRRAELPDTTFHAATRHTFATLLLSKGIHPKIVQELLGHAQIGLTLDTYSHVLSGMGEGAVAAIQDMLSEPDAEEEPKG